MLVFIQGVIIISSSNWKQLWYDQQWTPICLFFNLVTTSSLNQGKCTLFHLLASLHDHSQACYTFCILCVKYLNFLFREYFCNIACLFSWQLLETDWFCVQSAAWLYDFFLSSMKCVLYYKKVVYLFLYKVLSTVKLIMSYFKCIKRQVQLWFWTDGITSFCDHFNK